MGRRAKRVSSAIEPVARTERTRFSKLIVGILCGSLLATALAAGAADPASDDGWEFGAEVYLWAPWIDIETATGGNIEITLDDILSDLDLLFMADLGVRHGRWSVLSDFVYFEIDQGDNTPLLPGITLSDLTIEAWVVTPQVRYAPYETDDLRVEVLAGARYLWLEAQLDLDIEALVLPGGAILATRNVEDNASNWDGIVGVAGQWDFTDKWYASGYLDVGTGDSDYTWQALASVAYRFKWLDAVLGYRYLTWEFDSDAPIKDLTVHGPFVGAKFLF